MVYIYAVHMTGTGTHHEHIAAVKWKNPDDGQSGESTRAEMVNWIANEGGWKQPPSLFLQFDLEAFVVRARK